MTPNIRPAAYSNMQAKLTLPFRAFGDRSRSWLLGLGKGLAVLVICLLAAAAAISNSPVVIGVFVGLVLGVFLLMAPRLALWICVIGALLVSGATSLFLPQFVKVTWLFSMLGFFLTIASLIQLASRRATTTATPLFVWLGLAFMIYAIAVAPLAGSTGPEMMAGAKRYWQFWGLMFAGSWLMRDLRDFERIVKFLFVLALLQLPLALYQRLVLVPLRTGLGGGVVPIDVVSGTFEATMLGGGNSSAMVLFLTVAVAFALSAWREGAIGGWMCLLLLALFVVPMGVGETKVVVVFLPLMLLVVFGRYFRTAPLASLLMLVLGIGVALLLAWIYLTYFGKPGLSLEQRLQASIAYNFGSVGYYGAASLNRMAAMTYWWSNHGMANPHEMLFGHGLGSSYFAPSSFVQGHVAREHRYIGIGFSAASTVLWDLGVMGLMLLIAMLVSALRATSELLRIAPNAWARSSVVAARVGVLLFCVHIFYADSVLNALSVQCLLMIALGAVACAARYWVVAPSHSASGCSAQTSKAVTGLLWHP